MPRVNRPNAPQRLPSAAIERAFPRAKNRLVDGDQERLSTGSLSSEPALNIKSDTPSSVSPHTVVDTKYSARSSRGRLWSEANTGVLNVSPRGIDEPNSASKGRLSEGESPKSFPVAELEPIGRTARILEQIAPGIAKKSRRRLESQSSTDSLISDPDSTHSSLSGRSRKILGIPRLRVSVGASSDEKTPRPSASEYGWPHDVLREAGPVTMISPESKQGRTGGSKRESSETNGLAVASADLQDRLLLYPNSTGRSCHGRKRIPNWFRLRFGSKRSPEYMMESALRTRTGTEDVLESTTSALHSFAEKKSNAPSSSNSTRSSNLSIAATRWQHATSSRGKLLTGNSTSSSLNHLLRGKTPVTTPEPQDTYMGSDRKSYFVVEMTQPGAPAFLPSEARRVNTPPLPTSDCRNQKLRGFFFDYNAPDYNAPEIDGRIMGSPGGTPGLSSLSTPFPLFNAKPRRTSQSEWYRSKVVQEDSEAEADSDDEMKSRERFVLEIPDHLPNSPLCPRNPKNSSGGQGRCPVHGANQSRVTPRRESINDLF